MSELLTLTLMTNCATQKISEKKKSYYVITLAENPTDVRDTKLVCKLRANWVSCDCTCLSRYHSIMSFSPPPTCVHTHWLVVG